MYTGHCGRAKCDYLRYSGRALYRTRLNVIDSDIRVCCHVAHQRVRRWRSICSDGWTRVDQTDDSQCVYAATHGLRHCILYQLHRHVLSCKPSDTLRINGTEYFLIEFDSCYFMSVACIVMLIYNTQLFAGCSDVYLHICDITTDISRHDSWAKSCRDTGRSVSCERGASTDTREEVVYGAAGDHNARRNFTLRFNLH